MGGFSGQQFSGVGFNGTNLGKSYGQGGGAPVQSKNKGGIRGLIGRYLHPSVASTANPTGSVVGYPAYPTMTSDEGAQGDGGSMDASGAGDGVTDEMMAHGKLVTQPTRAVLGEQGPEMVVPLNANPQNHVNGLPRYNRGGY